MVEKRKRPPVDWFGFAAPKVGRVILVGGAYDALRKQVFGRDDWRCVICGSRENLELGHIIGRWNVRRDTPGNTACMCRVCNRGLEDGTLWVERWDGTRPAVVWARSNPEHQWVRVK
jgi:5-methylcytosine-specific restriction endonuclease McrA